MKQKKTDNQESSSKGLNIKEVKHKEAVSPDKKERICKCGCAESLHNKEGCHGLLCGCKKFTVFVRNNFIAKRAEK